MPNQRRVKIPSDIELVMFASLIRSPDGRWTFRVTGSRQERETTATLGTYHTRREAFDTLIAAMRDMYASDVDDAPCDISGIPGIPSPTEGNA